MSTPIPLRDLFSDATMARLVRDKVAAQGFYLADDEAVALLREIGVEATQERLQCVKLGFELGTCSRARGEALRLLTPAGRG